MTHGRPIVNQAPLQPENVYVDRGGIAGVSGVPWGTIQRWDALRLLPRYVVVQSMDSHKTKIVYRLSDILHLAAAERRSRNGATASRPAP